MAKRQIKAKNLKDNQYAVPVAMTDATKMMLSLSNVGMRVQELESILHQLASKHLELSERYMALEKRLTSTQELLQAVQSGSPSPSTNGCSAALPAANLSGSDTH